MSYSLTGLDPNTIYHFRVKATNPGGITYGDDLTFTTSKIAPTTTTGAATNIGTTTATLNGTVNANNDGTTIYFEYGLDLSYGSTADADQNPLNGLADTAVSANLTGLADLTLYHFRVVATNSAGTTYGADQTFLTDFFPGATINQALGQADPTNTTPIHFMIVFDKPIDLTTFTSDDLELGGTITDPVTVTILEMAPFTQMVFDISITDIPHEGTLTVSLPAGKVADTFGNANLASISIDNQVTYDLSGPTVAELSLEETYTRKGPDRFTITFDESLFDPLGNSEPNDVTNPANYLLVESGSNQLFDTTTCAEGLMDDDTQIPISSVIYDDGNQQVTVELLNTLPIDSYRLLICGTTSLYNLIELPLNDGEDTVFDFKVLPAPSTLPETGFAPGTETLLSAQPDGLDYSTTDMVLTIPSLNVEAVIIGIPQTNTSWNISWLGSRVGYLYGSAYPTWEGNTILTGHIWNADGSAGPFKDLKSLRYGDRITIESNGTTYIYEVRDSRLVNPSAVDSVFQSEDRDWITLVTCENYNPISGEYTLRRVVRAVLIDVR
ncbi:MAG: sortase [Anaerolineaceae bacterium]|nr:sortase [Anaerolineaceae bacterium]